MGTRKEIQKELRKCQASPYYFFMTYMKVNGEKPSTHLTEEEFNREFKELGRLEKEVKQIRRNNYGNT